MVLQDINSLNGDNLTFGADRFILLPPWAWSKGERGPSPERNTMESRNLI